MNQLLGKCGCRSLMNEDINVFFQFLVNYGIVNQFQWEDANLYFLDPANLLKTVFINYDGLTL